MSAVASFYTIRDAALPDLQRAAATPGYFKVKRFLLFKIRGEYHDPFWAFLTEHGDEQERFSRSGWCLTELLAVISERAVDISDYSDERTTNALSGAHGRPHWAFTSEQASRFLRAMAPLALDESHLGSLYPENADGFSPADIAAAAAVLRRWLQTVHDGRIGILSVW